MVKDHACADFCVRLSLHERDRQAEAVAVYAAVLYGGYVPLHDCLHCGSHQRNALECDALCRRKCFIRNRSGGSQQLGTEKDESGLNATLPAKCVIHFSMQYKSNDFGHFRAKSLNANKTLTFA